MEKHTSYGNLGTVFHSLGEYGKAQEYQEKALAISKRNWPQKRGSILLREPRNCVFFDLGEYEKAQEYLEKALAIRKEIGDRKGQAS